jgi:hypothetical protein
MIRSLCLLLVVFLVGCRAPVEKLQVMPVPVDGQPLSYADVVQRARTQASVALEAFYVDQWADLESAATGLEQSAGLLRKAVEVPAGRQAALGADADELARLATQLHEAASAKDVARANDLMRKISLKVRDLRPPTEKSAP